MKKQNKLFWAIHSIDPESDAIDGVVAIVCSEVEAELWIKETQLDILNDPDNGFETLEQVQEEWIYEVSSVNLWRSQ